MVAEPLECRVTNDLPSELAVASHASFACDLTTQHSPRFPGVLLTCSGQLFAAIGFDVEPGRTLAITAPVFFRQATSDVLEEWVRQLVSNVLSEAARRDCRTVRFLQPLTNPATSMQWLPILSDAGFTVHARISQWIKTISREGGGDSSTLRGDSSLPAIEFESLSCESLQTAADHRERILVLLRTILSDTQDLVTLPLPDPEDLLQDWMQQQGLIVVGRRGPAGIALCTCVSERPPDNSQTAVRIQYIGVVPEYRRCGAASALLRFLPQLFLVTDEPGTPKCLQLTAFSDASNAAARQLYQTEGFHVDSEFDLWCLEVRCTRAAPEM